MREMTNGSEKRRKRYGGCSSVVASSHVYGRTSDEEEYKTGRLLKERSRDRRRQAE